MNIKETIYVILLNFWPLNLIGRLSLIPKVLQSKSKIVEFAWSRQIVSMCICGNFTGAISTNSIVTPEVVTSDCLSIIHSADSLSDTIIYAWNKWLSLFLNKWFNDSLVMYLLFTDSFWHKKKWWLCHCIIDSSTSFFKNTDLLRNIHISHYSVLILTFTCSI